jgi:hypothetical protein
METTPKRSAHLAWWSWGRRWVFGQHSSPWRWLVAAVVRLVHVCGSPADFVRGALLSTCGSLTAFRRRERQPGGACWWWRSIVACLPPCTREQPGGGASPFFFSGVARLAGNSGSLVELLCACPEREVLTWLYSQGLWVCAAASAVGCSQKKICGRHRWILEMRNWPAAADPVDLFIYFLACVRAASIDGCGIQHWFVSSWHAYVSIIDVILLEII